MRRAARFSSAFVIPNGVDFSRFYPIPRQEVRAILGWHPERFYILFANRPSLAGKRFSLAEAAVQCLQERSLDVELVVASGLSQELVMLYINAANVLILTSINEGSPNVVKEAMACNIPIVSTDVGDVSQVIEHTKGCFICSATSVALADSLQLALAYTESTTGRADIAHLENSQVACRVLDAYAYAIEVHRSRRLFARKTHPAHNAREQVAR
jgi:glycosyltransferase involved in cell wall biosynthesis